MELILIRHARPEHIEGGSGPADPPLTGLGERQAGALAAWLADERLDGLYTSPMLRARQTAEPLGEVAGLRAVEVAELSEYDADSSSYVPLEVIRQDREAWRAFLAEQDATDRNDFVTTVVAGIERLIAAHPGDRIAAVCHGGVINVWAGHVLGLDQPRMFFDPYYTSVNRFLAASSGERSIASLNETGHLRSDGLRLPR